jgi:hypothetical protein
MEQEADSVTIRNRASMENAAQLAQIAACSVSASLLLGLAASLLGAWFGTRHVRQIAVEKPTRSAPEPDPTKPRYDSFVR